MDIVRQGFIQADVVKWREGIWEKRGPYKGKVVRVGDRLMIAEVLQEADEEGWYLLLVREWVRAAVLDPALTLRHRRWSWRPPGNKKTPSN
jgi:hypothetical protein